MDIHGGRNLCPGNWPRVDEHHVLYKRLEADAKHYTEAGHRVTFAVKRTCDLINCVDLALPNPGGHPVRDMITRIDVSMGGICIDTLCARDIDTQVRANCALGLGPGRHGRITHDDSSSVSYVPLAMAPFHSTNMVISSSTWSAFPLDKPKLLILST